MTAGLIRRRLRILAECHVYHAHSGFLRLFICSYLVKCVITEVLYNWDWRGFVRKWRLVLLCVILQ